jgi:hypothetical protein
MPILRIREGANIHLMDLDPLCLTSSADDAHIKRALKIFREE